MEEESSEEWEVEKQGNGGNSKTSFIMRVGKKIVITGMVISSAPFFLPPLLVVSSVGFAFAVPFGLVFASYACTEKVMSKLLSRPNVESIEEREGGRDEMEMDEEEFEEDVKHTLEMRIELIGDEDVKGEVDAEEENRFGGSFEEGSEESMEDMYVEDLKGAIEEEKEMVNEGYYLQDDVVAVDNEQETVPSTWGEVLIQEHGGEENVDSFEEGGMPIEPMREGEGGEEIDAYILGEPMTQEVPAEETEADFQERGNGMNGVIYVQEEEPLEVILESGYKENGVFHTPLPIEEKAVVEEMVDSSKADEIEEEEKPLVATMEMEEGRVGIIEDNIAKAEMPHLEANELKVITIIENAREIADESGFDLFDVVTATLEQYRSESNEDIISPDTVSYHISQSMEVNSLPKHISIELSSANEEHIEKCAESMVHPVSSDSVENQPINLVPETTPTKQEYILNTTTGECADSVVHPLSSESVESQPLNLVPETTPSQESYQVSQARFVDSAPENTILELSSANEDHTSDIMSKESVVLLSHPVSSDTFEDKPASLVSDTTSSKEALYSEEKMWELMGAMRKIVGYKGDIQPSFAEELKALYIFTGVEPPVAFKNPLDLVEVNDKVRLLMGIIGVK